MGPAPDVVRLLDDEDGHVSLVTEQLTVRRDVTEPVERPSAQNRTLTRVATLISFLVSLGIIIWAWQSGALKDVDHLRAVIGGMGWWTIALFIAIQAAQVVVPILPGGLGILAGPILFGPIMGSVWNYVGICIGSFIAFGIARANGPEFLEKRFSPKLLKRYRKLTDNRRFTTLFAIAIAAPIAPDDFLCYLAGTTRMSWRTFAIIILTCKPWAIVAYSFGLLAILTKLGIVGI